MDSEQIFKEMKEALGKTIDNKKLANKWVEMHMAFIRSTRTYVDNQVGFGKSANTRSNDNSKDINKLENIVNSLLYTINNINHRIGTLETPLYKRTWNYIKCMSNKLKN